ncbi:MAG TPA: transporter substrate-binding domain-containing protein, partial [Arenimonas sp.]|nr:transporter substrate-binding domain-containing protein [Arenimonas sp.]
MKSLLAGSLAIVFLLASMPVFATGLRFRLCTEGQPFLPLISMDPERPGDAQILLAMAAERLGVRIEHVQTTWQRCQQMLDRGEVDALNGASFAAINRAIAEYPMRLGEADPTRSLGEARTYLLRRVGSPVALRQGRFVDLKTPVGIIRAYQINSLSVSQFGGIPDHNSLTLESLARRLAAGELDLVAGNRALLVLCATAHAGKLEVLPQPLDVAHYYLAFGKAFHARHRQAIEALWTEIGRIKASPEYQARINRASPG